MVNTDIIYMIYIENDLNWRYLLVGSSNHYRLDDGGGSEWNGLDKALEAMAHHTYS